MQTTDGEYVIVCRSFGSYDVQPCTLAAARALLAEHESQLPQEVRALAESAKTDAHLVTTDLLDKAMHEACTLPVGSESSSLRAVMFGRAPRGDAPDTRPLAVVSQELQAECVLWMVGQKLNPLVRPGLSAQLLNTAWLPAGGLIQQALQQRVAPKPVVFVNTWEFDMYLEYQQLKSGGWKDSANEHNVVSRYLTFITDHLTHRDVAYEVAPFRKST